MTVSELRERLEELEQAQLGDVPVWSRQGGGLDAIWGDTTLELVIGAEKESHDDKHRVVLV